MLPGRGGRVDLSRRSPGASARAPCESVSPARGCPLAAWQTVSPSVSPAEAPQPFLPPGDRPRTAGRAGRPGVRVPRVPRVGPASRGQLGRAGRPRKSSRAKEFPGGTTLFTCTTPKGLNLYMGGGGRRAMRAGAVPPSRCQAKNVRAGGQAG